MQIDRKLFLKALAFAGGGTAGLMTSPAPWHFIRDLARWTQNWPWVPVPPHGKPSTVSSICGMCTGECGILVRKVDERMVRIEGNSHHPVNRGFICPLGIAALQMVYGPARVRQPLKRAASRGEGKWQAISWEDAIGEFAGKIQELRTARQSHTVACITANSDGTTNELLERFLRAIGSRNLTKMNSGRDARSAVLQIMQGIDGDLAYDFENADFILSFGCSFFEGWGTCGRMYGAIEAWDSQGENRVELIQIEPNLSTTALKASRWIPNKPGTDAALALGIAHVLISEGSYNNDFVDKHCFGFRDWEDKEGKKHRGFSSLVLANYSPPSVERITGVSVKDIEGLAQRFAAANRPLAVGGGGRGEFFSGIHELMAIHALNALAGNINKRGGVLVKAPVPLTPLPEVQMDAEAARGYAESSAKNLFSFSSPGSLNPDEIKLLLVHEANPLYALPEQSVAEKLFDEVPCIVSFSSYMDESAEHSDLILPLSTRFERWDDRIAAPELHHAAYNFCRPVCQPIYDTKTAGDILGETAKRLGGTIAASFPWISMKEVLMARARGLFQSGEGKIDAPDLPSTESADVSSYASFTEMWEKLQERSCWFNPSGYGKPEEILKTPSGKFELYSQFLKNHFALEDDEKCMPHYEPPDERPQGFDLLIMAEDMMLIGNDGKPTPPFLIKQLDETVLKKNDLYVQINPITAMYHNLAEGDRVLMESPAGKIEVRLHLYEGVREGVVLVPLGFGHSAYDKFLRGKGVNVKRLIVAKTDAITGLPLWRTTPGKLTKA